MIGAAFFTDRPRLGERLARNHLTLLALSMIASVVADRFLCEPSSPLLFRASLASGYVALLWLAATLAYSPLRALRGRTVPSNSYLRRDLGFWSALTAVLHTILSLCISTTGMVQLHEFFFHWTEHGLSLRFDTLGWANHTGAVATLVALVLLLTSSDAAIRQLGPRSWKNLQRSVYAAAALVLVHGVLYQSMIERSFVTLTAFWGPIGTCLLLRLGAAARRR